MSREICTTASLPLDPTVAFQLLVTPSHIRQWWTARAALVIPEAGGMWTAAWGEDEDRPDYVASARISEWVPGRLLTLADYQYYSKDGALPFDADFSTRFELERDGNNSLLTVRQTGFPDDPAADAYYAACQQGWDATLQMMRDYAQTLSRRD